MSLWAITTPRLQEGRRESGGGVGSENRRLDIEVGISEKLETEVEYKEYGEGRLNKVGKVRRVKRFKEKMKVEKVGREEARYREVRKEERVYG